MSDENHNMIFRALAQYAFDSLVQKTRKNGESYTCFELGSADWLGRLANKAHNDELPNNWRYNAMYAMLEQLVRCEGEDARDEARNEVCDILVDDFDSDRIAWLSGNLSRLAACDEADDEGLAGQFPT